MSTASEPAPDASPRSPARAGVLRPARVALLVAGAGLAVVVGLLAHNALLSARFSDVHVMQSEAHLLETAGEPSTTWACDEGPYALPNSDRCARIHHYRTYLVKDGWVVPIAHDGEIMGIRRLNFPH